MKFLKKILPQSPEINIEELQSALEQAGKDRRKSQRELKRWHRKRNQLVERMKNLRSQSQNLEVDDLWEELKDHRLIGNELRQERRIYSIEEMALRKTIRTVKRLDRRSDHSAVETLLRKLQQSSLFERLAIESENQEDYLAEISEILGEFDTGSQSKAPDLEKELFLAELDGISSIEKEGAVNDAQQRQKELLEGFDLVEEQPNPHLARD